MCVSEKYPRTSHVPWSKGGTADDVTATDVAQFIGVPVVITEKLDGENQSWTPDAVYARSHGAMVVHASNSWSKQLWGSRKHLLSPGLSVFFEYTFALHSIWYERMALEKQYAHIFGVRDDATGVWWAWDEVEMMAEYLRLPTVPVLFKGTIQSEEELKTLMPGTGTTPSVWRGVPIVMKDSTPHTVSGYAPDTNIREGEVVRLQGVYSDFQSSVAKCVRKGHVQSDEHWKRSWRPMHDWSPDHSSE